MKGSFRFIVWALGIALIVGCGGGGGGGGGGTTANVSGRVVVFGTAVPIGGASVTVGARDANSAANGTFAILSLATGNTTITVRAGGYEDSILTITLQAGDNALGDIGLTTSNPPPPPYTISGKVTIQGTIDASGVVVEAKNANASDLKTTGRSGEFFLLVPPGNYTVTATKAGYTSNPLSYNVVVADPNQPVQDRNFTLSP